MEKIKRTNKGYLKANDKKYVKGQEIIVTTNSGTDCKGVLHNIGFNGLIISCTEESESGAVKIFMYDNIKDVRLAWGGNK